VARIAPDPLLVHPAPDEIIPLHPVLVGRPVGPVREGVLAETMFFEIPGCAQPVTGLVAHGPIVVPALERIRARAALRVALDAHIVRAHIVKTSGVDDVRLRGARNVSTARAVAPLAADVPLRDRVCLDVVVHRVAAVAERSRWTR